MSTPMFLSVVPWRNPEQFRKVFKSLYSSSITEKRWAVDQIAVWQSRCHPGLPIAIEATVVLVRAVIQDMLYEVEQSLRQTQDIQVFYAYALIKFVNLTLEVEQNAFKNPPLSVVAEQKNIPKWIVHLRHDAVHSSCPSLPMLRMGADVALTYLKNSFWTVESANIRSIVNTPSDVNQEILDLITQYRNIQHTFQKCEGNINERDLTRDRRAVLKKLGQHIGDSKEEVIETLVHPGVFICTEDLVKILQASAPLFMELEDNVSLPYELERFWFPLVRVLHRFGLIHRFLEKLLLSQEKCNINICQKIAAAWAIRIFLATSSHTCNKALDRIFKDKAVLFSLPRLLYACMKGFNKYLIHFFDMVVDRLGNREKYSELFCIVGMKQGYFVPAGVASGPQTTRPSTSSKLQADTALSEIVFTLADIVDDLNEMKARRKRPRRDDNIWSKAPASLDMSKIPLGAVLNPVNIEESAANEEPQPEISVENPSKEVSFILSNENDNEEMTVEERDTPDNNWLDTLRPEEFDMMYKKAKN